jgi:hypothetical protein
VGKKIRAFCNFIYLASFVGYCYNLSAAGSELLSTASGLQLVLAPSSSSPIVCNQFLLTSLSGCPGLVKKQLLK